jgi:hypothetical protein
MIFPTHFPAIIWIYMPLCSDNHRRTIGLEITECDIQYKENRVIETSS